MKSHEWKWRIESKKEIEEEKLETKYKIENIKYNDWKYIEKNLSEM